MNPEPWQRERDVAVRIVRDAALLARAIELEIHRTAFLKPDQSPVTIGDLAVQAVIATRLAAEFPADPLVAEEDSSPLQGPDAHPLLANVLEFVRRLLPAARPEQVLSAIDRGRGLPGGRFWTLDPVDGTKGFLRGGQYVVALALVVAGKVELGVLGCPRLSWTAGHTRAERAEAPYDAGSIVFAVRNHGAFSAPLAMPSERGLQAGSRAGDAELTPLRVSSIREPRAARLLRSYESAHIDLQACNMIVERLGVDAAPTLMDSQAKHTMIAAGRSDLLLRVPARPGFRDKIWDQAAGSIIVEEAGGRVTDLHGADLDFSTGRLLARNDGVVASNGVLHAAALVAIEGRVVP